MTGPRPSAPQVVPSSTPPPTAEHARLAESPESTSPWRLWGTYLSARQWGTVREDYSADGDAWNYLPFDDAHRRAYRWGEDGLGGWCDRYGFLNFSVALWNGQDDRLKERLFGLTNPEGNHGEDVKEYWWALDNTPTHSWAQWLYRYPQAAFPYERLRSENARRTRRDREFELADTGVLDGDRFFDVQLTYAKAGPDDVVMVVEATNHGPDAAPLDLVPQLWLRNTWAWGRDDRRGTLTLIDGHDLPGDVAAVVAQHDYLGRYVLAAEGVPEVLFCENETDARTLFGSANRTPFVKDGIDRAIVHGDAGAVNPAGTGTKVALRYHFPAVAPGRSVRVRLRLSTSEVDEHTFGPGVDAVLADRRREADDFYAHVLPERTDDTDRDIARRAFAGLLWNKQLYRYTVDEWLAGDPSQPPPPAARRTGRNATWTNLALADIICMPDEWEYPWFAAWDTAFHCVALAHVDPRFAKEQLLLLCREWAMHPDGQLPAYEWAFGDVNPPVHAWAAWRVFHIDGGTDHDFLVRVFSKLLFNVGWWVNREDADGSDVFTGGFLGMDNIALFDRSAVLPGGARLEESDATSWVAFYFLNMLKIAVQLSLTDPAWDETATKFLEHFLAIARAANSFGSTGADLWDDADGFYYDVLVHPDGRAQPLPVRSMVGLLPILAVAEAPRAVATALPDLTARLQWLQRRRPDLMGGLVSRSGPHGEPADQLLSLVSPDRLVRLLERVFDEGEFLSPYGIRSLSAAYRTPLTVDVGGTSLSIDYEPGESTTDLFGGNSNWRGPVWFPVNVLLADALRTHASVLGELTVELPAGSGRRVSLAAAADEIDRRLIALFRPGAEGRRPSDGARIEASGSALWREHVTFSEYFDGDTGEGLGASHQTGWTALVAHLICRADRS